ncbi:hypothetical protein GGX14DRAFT_563005 [Mycena pura]|uniref:Uncharacterized protein n=1 Tax=Mycena pura TaxID=153505 RepID=A0AAD6VJS6_9AGAR|nr:hypothetical protein GGX14DRAFT_563005 [Mycena pura]
MGKQRLVDAALIFPIRSLFPVASSAQSHHSGTSTFNHLCSGPSFAMQSAIGASDSQASSKLDSSSTQGINTSMSSCCYCSFFRSHVSYWTLSKFEPISSSQRSLRWTVDIRSREEIQLDVAQDRLEPGVKRPGTSASNNTGTGANASLSTPPTPRSHTSNLHHCCTRARSLAKAPPPPPAPFRPFTRRVSVPRACASSALTQADIASRAQELLDDTNFLYAGGAAHGVYIARGSSFVLSAIDTSASPYSLALADILASLQELLRSITGRATQQHFSLRASAARTGAISIRAISDD